jgi:hypothetical protein
MTGVNRKLSGLVARKPWPLQFTDRIADHLKGGVPKVAWSYRIVILLMYGSKAAPTSLNYCCAASASGAWRSSPLRGGIPTLGILRLVVLSSCQILRPPARLEGYHPVEVRDKQKIHALSAGSYLQLCIVRPAPHLECDRQAGWTKCRNV